MSPFFDELEQQLHTAAASHSGRQRWWRRPRNVAFLAVAALGLATPAVARVSGIWDPAVEQPLPARPPAVTVPASASTTCTEPRRPDPPPSAGARLDPELLAQLAVLRRRPRAGDVLARNEGGGAPNVDQTSTRYVGSIAGTRYFVAAAASRVHTTGCSPPPATSRLDLCLLVEHGGGGCGISARTFRKQGLEGSSGASDNRSVVVGLVPDEVAAVTLRYGTSERSFTVKNNFYGFEVAVDVMRQPDSLIWTLRDGIRRKIR